MSDFWQKYLTVWCAGVVLFGVGLYGGGYAATDGFNSFFYELLNSNENPLAYDSYMRLAMGLIGAITIGWGLTFYVLFRAAFQLEGEAAAKIWKQVIVAMTIWVVIDNFLSVQTGFALNAVSNSVFYILALIPIFKSGVLRGK